MPADGLLTWQADRWHLNDRAIHAGAEVQVRGNDGTWHAARFESQDVGRILLLLVEGPDGFDYGRRIANANHERTLFAPVRWRPGPHTFSPR